MTDHPSDASDAGAAGSEEPSPTLIPRLDRLAHLEMTPQREAFRRLAAEMREVIDLMTSTDASPEELDGAANSLHEVAETLRGHRKGRPYEGFSELSNAPGRLDEESLKAITSAIYATFDHSPFIGLANPLSPPVYLRIEGDRVLGDATFGSAYEGPPGCVHGGYIAATFDEMLGSAQALSGAQGMTAFLHVDYRSPTPLHQPLRLEAWVDRREGRKIFCRGAIRVGETLCAEAEGLFVSTTPQMFRELLEARNR